MTASEVIRVLGEVSNASSGTSQSPAGLGSSSNKSSCSFECRSELSELRTQFGTGQRSELLFHWLRAVIDASPPACRRHARSPPWRTDISSPTLLGCMQPELKYKAAWAGQSHDATPGRGPAPPPPRGHCSPKPEPGALTRDVVMALGSCWRGGARGGRMVVSSVLARRPGHAGSRGRLDRRHRGAAFLRLVVRKK